MKILLIYNFAQHYRAPIFKKIDRELKCDFVFGDRLDDIKKMDYSILEGNVLEVHNIKFPFGYYQKGVASLINKDYDTYIILGEIRCISTWLFLIKSLFISGKRIFLWSHGWLGKENWIKRIISKIFYSFCDGAFIYNNRSRKLMIKGGIPAKKLFTIYNSLDYDTQLAIRCKLSHNNIYKEHFQNENPVLIFIGRLTSVKRLNMVIEALTILKTNNENYNLVLVGDGTERSNLENLVSLGNLQKQVWFYGACYDERQNAELIYNADLCVSPGNIGLTAMHVLMFGCPAMTNNDFNWQMPEFEAIHEGKTGGFFKYNDVISLANEISNWFKIHISDREKIRENCYKEIDIKWNPHNQIKIIKSILTK